jgi:hypothetical protein
MAANRVWRFLLRTPAWMWVGVALSLPAATSRADTSQLKSVEITDKMTCQIVEGAAGFAGIPVAVLTRLVWTESRFRADLTSSAGAQGVAQFMPQTAAERGLPNPFNPEQAIPRAAEFLADLYLRFGNIGLAAAAYNAGATRVVSWLAGSGALALETRAYVLSLTGHTVEEWAHDGKRPVYAEAPTDRPSCLAVVASLRTHEGEHRLTAAWDFPFERNLLSMTAMATFDEARQRYCRQLDAHWPRARTVAFTRQGATLDDFLPPLCSAYSR